MQEANWEPQQHIRTLFLLCILLRCMSDFNEDCFQARVLFVSVVLCRVLSPSSVLSPPSAAALVRWSFGVCSPVTSTPERASGGRGLCRSWGSWSHLSRDLKILGSRAQCRWEYVGCIDTALDPAYPLWEGDWLEKGQSKDL